MAEENVHETSSTNEPSDLVEHEIITESVPFARVRLLIDICSIENRPANQLIRRATAEYIAQDILYLRLDHSTILEGKSIRTLRATRLLHDEEGNLVARPNRRVLLSYENGTPIAGVIGILTYEGAGKDTWSDLVQRVIAEVRELLPPWHKES